MRNLIITLLILCLTSCGLHSDGIDVVVKNNSGDTINDVMVHTIYSQLEIGDMQKGAIFLGHLDMSEEPPAEGGYMLYFKDKHGEEIRVGDGYYTMGRPLYRRITFTVEPDTVLLKSSNFGRSLKGW